MLRGARWETESAGTRWLQGWPPINSADGGRAIPFPQGKGLLWSLQQAGASAPSPAPSCHPLPKKETPVLLQPPNPMPGRQLLDKKSCL